MGFQELLQTDPAVRKILLDPDMINQIVTDSMVGGVPVVKKETFNLLTLERTKIGEGSASQVFKMKYNDKDVSLKVQQRTPKLEKTLLKQIVYLSLLEHPNIMQCLAADINPYQINVVFPYYEHNLKSLLATKPQHSLWKLAMDIASALKYMHSFGVIHCDLKPTNILISDWNSKDNMRAVLTDCGSPPSVAECVMVGDIDTLLYMSPEMLNAMPFDSKTDIFSFGLILWNLITKEVDFKVMYKGCASIVDVIAKVKEGFQPAILKDTSRDAADLMNLCWNGSPNNRPTLSDIITKLEAWQTL